MNIQQELQDFYNKEAAYWHTTRKKHRPELDHICRYIDTFFEQETKTITIVELGCGDGRLYDFLYDRYGDRISYIGVDISQKLLDCARKSYPKAQWIHADMLSYVSDIQQQSVDICISLASFHHIPSAQERQQILHGIYAMLEYDGAHITINWAWSNWFRRKYAKAIRQAWRKRLSSAGTRDKRDLYVPFTNPDNQEKSYRYYHMFRVQELIDLSHISGFVLEEVSYIDKKGGLTDKKNAARNIRCVQRKKVFVAS